MPDFPLLTDKSHPSPQRRHYRLHGQKPPLKPREVWAIRVRLQIQGALRDLALFNPVSYTHLTLPTIYCV